VAEDFAETNQPPISFLGIAPPTREDNAWAIEKSRHSATGPDGLPFSQRGRPLAQQVWELCSESCRNSSRVQRPQQPWEISIYRTWFFPPRGELSRTLGIIREPAAARPIDFKNTDNKVIGNICNYKISAPTAAWAHSAQTCFAKVYNFLNHVVEVDTYARITDLVASNSLPLLVLWDFATAFPSVAHAFVLIVLTAACVSEALINLSIALRADNRVCVVVDGTVRSMYPVMSGALQGCPMSATVFVIAFHMFLVHVRSVGDVNFILRAAVGDLGGVLQSIRDIIPLCYAGLSDSNAYYRIADQPTEVHHHSRRGEIFYCSRRNLIASGQSNAFPTGAPWSFAIGASSSALC
jgi:hypothetical protein